MRVKSQRQHKIRRVVHAVSQTAWMIEESTLQAIRELLELRSAGQEFDVDEIQMRIGGGRASDDEGGPRIQDGVAVLPLYGVLAPRMNLMMDISGGTSTQVFAGWFRDALADPQVRAIVLDVDSPGGSAVGNEEVAQLIRSARGPKPIVAVATSMMASAAYYIGSAVDEIVASPSAWLGSIGAYMVHGETSRADANAGLTYTVIQAGANKAVGNDVEPLTAKGRAVLQERVDDSYRQFVAAVAANRKTSVETVEQNFGQGKVLLAPRAVAAGLADRIGTLDQVVAELAQATRPKSSGQWPVASGQPLTRPSTGGPHHQSPLNSPALSPAPHFPPSEAPVNPKIKAALVARGLITADASDQVAQAVLHAFFAAQAQTAPSDEAAVVSALAKPAEPKTAEQKPVEQKPAGQTDRPADVTADRIRTEERARIEDIRARGLLLGVSQETVDAAINAGESVGQALVRFTGAEVVRQPPVSQIRSGDAQGDKFAAAAVEALGARCSVGGNKPLSDAARPLRHKSLLQMAELCLQQAGVRLTGDPDDIATAALRGDGSTLNVRSSDTAYNRPSDFPNLLSALAGKMMDAALTYSPATYKMWAHQMPSVADFKPKTIMAVGEFAEFPRVPDGDDFTDSTIGEEASFIAVDTYGDEFSVTPRMVVDDDLGAFDEAARDKQIAHDMTLNRLCVELLTGNAKAGDGIDLFHATHANDRTAGAAPTTAELAAMRLLLRKQSGVGGRRKLNLTLKGLLVPEDLETAVQTLLSADISVVPVTTATGEIFRGSVDYWVEPQLGEHSALKYYGFADPKLARAIVYCFQRGFETMKSKLYFNPKNNCRVLQCEGRFAAAIRNWRGVVRNKGEA